MSEPVWLSKARTYVGITEGAGAKDNATILNWAKKLGGWVGRFFTHDSVAWCGLFVATVMTQAGFSDIPANPLGALNWSAFGKQLKVPALGAIMTFKRPGGGHVAFYLGEDATAYHVLGGNQSNAVGVTRIDKSRLAAIRWPIGAPDPQVWGVKLSPAGKPLSANEA